MHRQRYNPFTPSFARKMTSLIVVFFILPFSISEENSRTLIISWGRIVDPQFKEKVMVYNDDTTGKHYTGYYQLGDNKVFVPFVSETFSNFTWKWIPLTSLGRYKYKFTSDGDRQKLCKKNYFLFQGKCIANYREQLYKNLFDENKLTFRLRKATHAITKFFHSYSNENQTSISIDDTNKSYVYNGKLSSSIKSWETDTPYVCAFEIDRYNHDANNAFVAFIKNFDDLSNRKEYGFIRTCEPRLEDIPVTTMKSGAHSSTEELLKRWNFKESFKNWKCNFCSRETIDDSMIPFCSNGENFCSNDDNGRNKQ